jgi:hypothetical protein
VSKALLVTGRAIAGRKHAQHVGLERRIGGHRDGASAARSWMLRATSAAAA